MTTAYMSRTANKVTDTLMHKPLIRKSMRLWAPLAVIALTLFSLNARAEPLLNGLAVSTELGKERFIAALYSDKLTTSARDILDSSISRSMELKIIADRLSARSLNNMWIEGIAINNSGSALEQQANNTLKLTKFVRRRLVSGDVLRFDFEPGKGVDVVLNSINLGNISSDGFFNMLLRTWIGSVPLSSEFRDDLLSGGDINQELVNRYTGIQPQNGRKDAVAAWLEPTTTETAAATTSSKPKIKLDPPKPKLTLSEMAPPTISAISSSEEKKTAVADQLPKAVDETPAPTTDVAAEPVLPSPENTVALTSEPAPIEYEAEDDEIEEEFSLASIIDRQRYQNQIFNISKSALRYPRIAQQRGQEGDVRAKLVLNRDGSVKSRMIVEEAPYSSLNKAIEKLIDRLSPYPPVPDSVSGEEFEISMQFGFKLQ